MAAHASVNIFGRLRPVRRKRNHCLMPDVPDPWHTRAACRGHNPELWYPNRDDKLSHRLAAKVCGECPVQTECLDTALQSRDEHGIWGGKTYQERMRTPRRSFRAESAINHGTLQGYRHHLLLKEEPCRPCVEADERRKDRMVCGTHRGYDAHQRAREPACEPCKRAYAEHARRHRAERTRRRELSISKSRYHDNHRP